MIILKKEAKFLVISKFSISSKVDKLLKLAVFDYHDYKGYLQSCFPSTGQGRGLRSKLAGHLGCQTGFISQVLNGESSHFSLEHGLLINEFLEHTIEESRYFLLLLQKDRSGTKKLTDFFDKQIREITAEREIIRNRIRVKESVSRSDQLVYCSSWVYAAVHVLLMIPEFQTRQAVAQRLKLPISIISECIDFLIQSSLAIVNGEKIQVGPTRLHFGKESGMMAKYHSNWRMKAIQDLDLKKQDSLHFSSLVSISSKDAEKIQGILLKAIEQSEALIQASPEEDTFCVGIDFFRI